MLDLLSFYGHREIETTELWFTNEMNRITLVPAEARMVVVADDSSGGHQVVQR